MKDRVRFGITVILWFLAVFLVFYAFSIPPPLQYTPSEGSTTAILLVFGLFLGGAGFLPFFIGDGSDTRSYLGSSNSSGNEKYNGYTRNNSNDSGSWNYNPVESRMEQNYHNDMFQQAFERNQEWQNRNQQE